MIAAGLLLGAIGVVDAVRPLVPARRRWIVLAGTGLLIFVLGVADHAVVGALVAVAGTAAWVWLMPAGGRGRAGFWPAIGLVVVCALELAVAPRTGGGWLGELWRIDSPVGPIGFDQAVLVVAVVLFLIEPANAVVRVALAQEHVGEPEPTRAGDDDAEDQPSAPQVPMLKGGRLIGPIERIIVLALTLAAAYPLLAAFIAAKGIVRFPEISQDSGTGNRAEYFLIGSLVSWVLGLAGAFIVWWAFSR